MMQHPVYGNGIEFKDGTNQTIEYAYDKNGNLTKDLNKKIAVIQYNLLNLPSQVIFVDGNVIEYEYGSDGRKLRTAHVINGVTSITDYCGNAIYENGSLKMLRNEAGYISFPDKKFHFYLKDHQGNIRVVADKDGYVEETNDYYPFGGLFTTVSNVQPYKYNGKELDRKNGIDWYDYGTRHYDPAIGRFVTTDIMREKYYSWSPYTYCMGNPINHIDPDGNTVVIWYNNDAGKKVSYSYSGGDITHPNSFVQSVITAYQYNKANGLKAGNGGGASTVAIVENTNIKVNVTEATLRVAYNPDVAHGAGSIYWKSNWGSQRDNGVINSPATLFDHEADHALEHKTNAQEYEKNRVPVIHNIRLKKNEG